MPLLLKAVHRALHGRVTRMTTLVALGTHQPMSEGALARHLGSSYAWLTRGAHETLGRNCVKEVTSCPPLDRVVVDAVGAGDAFCAVASLAATSKAPLNIATFMGQLAGSQAVKIVGNAEPIRKTKLLKGGVSMLAF